VRVGDNAGSEGHCRGGGGEGGGGVVWGGWGWGCVANVGVGVACGCGLVRLMGDYGINIDLRIQYFYIV
jgi:hypothetical protein